MSTFARWRGLKDLVQSAVEVGSRAVERVQKETVQRPLRLLEAMPAIAVPAAGFVAIHDLVVGSIHHAVRVTNRMVGGTLDRILDSLDEAPPSS